MLHLFNLVSYVEHRAATKDSRFTLFLDRVSISPQPYTCCPADLLSAAMSFWVYHVCSSLAGSSRVPPSHFAVVIRLPQCVCPKYRHLLFFFFSSLVGFWLVLVQSVAVGMTFDHYIPNMLLKNRLINVCSFWDRCAVTSKSHICRAGRTSHYFRMSASFGLQFNSLDLHIGLV